MISVRLFQILTILSLVLGLVRGYQHQAPESCAQATNVEKALKKRAIGSLRQGVEDFARAPTGAAGRLDDEFTDTEQTYRAVSSQGITNDHEGHEPAPAITKLKLPLKRKAEIAESSAKHQKKIAEMRTEWQGISTSFESLKQRKEELTHLEDLQMHIKADSTKTIDDILEELTIFYRYILHLVQNRLRELGGLGGIVIGTKKKEKQESYLQEGLGSTKTNREINIIKQEGKHLKYSREKLPQLRNVLGHSALHIVLRENIMAQKTCLEKSDVSVIARNDPTFDATMRELNEDPSELISDKLKAEKIQELNNILHSFTFSPLPEFTFRPQHEVRMVKKTAFDFIFKILQFMYKFEMINKDHLRSFFKTHETQELIGAHLIDLLNVYWRGFWNQKTNLIPDMSLITRHWQTQHLHIILKELDENQIKSITYVILTGTMRSYLFSSGLWVRHTATVHGLLAENKFLSRLKESEVIDQTKSKKSNDQDPDLMDYLKAIIDWFQNPIPTNSGPEEKISQQIDYLLTFCVIKFIIDHHPKVIENSFSSIQEHEVFQNQFFLMQAGLNLHQQINQVLDDKFLFQIDYLKQNSIPETVSKRRTERIKLEIKENLTKTFFELRKKVIEISTKDLKVNEWIHERSISGGIIEFLTQRASSIKNVQDLILGITKDQYRNGFLI